MIMFYTYVLFSPEFNKIYIGYTSNLEARISSHNDVRNRGWSSRYRPWKLLYYESFETKQEAMKREKQLKTYRGREFIRSLIK